MPASPDSHGLTAYVPGGQDRTPAADKYRPAFKYVKTVADPLVKSTPLAAHLPKVALFFPVSNS